MTDQSTPQPNNPATPEPITCGHPHHRDDDHHYDQGRTYAAHILDAIAAANAQDRISAELNTHIADRILWQHADTCADDLRDFIAGIANANEHHLQGLGTTIHY